MDGAAANAVRIGTHANVDVTIEMALKAYEHVLTGWQWDNPRFRIEHCSPVNPGLPGSIKTTGAIPAPFYTAACWRTAVTAYFFLLFTFNSVQYPRKFTGMRSDTSRPVSRINLSSGKSG